MMTKWIQLLVIVSIIVSCKSSATAQKEVGKSEQTPAYQQQMENLENGFYFRAVGNEPDWSLKISEKTIEFSSLKPGFETLKSEHKCGLDYENNTNMFCQ